MTEFDNILKEIDINDNEQMYLYGAGMVFKNLRLYYRRSPLKGIAEAGSQLISEMSDVFEEMKAKITEEAVLDNVDLIQGMNDTWGFIEAWLNDHNAYPKPSEIEPMINNSVKKIRFRDFVIIAGNDFFTELRSGHQPVENWLDAFCAIIMTMYGDERYFYGRFDIEPWRPDVFETIFCSAVPDEKYETDIRMLRCNFEKKRFYSFDIDYWEEWDDYWGYEEEADESKPIFDKDNYRSSSDINYLLRSFYSSENGCAFATDEEACRNALYIAYCLYGYSYLTNIVDPAEFADYKAKKKDEDEHFRDLEKKIMDSAYMFSDRIREKIEEAVSGNADTAYMLGRCFVDSAESIEDEAREYRQLCDELPCCCNYIIDGFVFYEIAAYYGNFDAIKRMLDYSIDLPRKSERERNARALKKLAEVTGREESEVVFDYAADYKMRSLNNDNKYIASDESIRARNIYDYAVKAGRRLDYTEYYYYHDDELLGTELIDDIVKTADYIINGLEKPEGDWKYNSWRHLTPYVCDVFGSLLRGYSDGMDDIARLAFQYYFRGEQNAMKHRTSEEKDYQKYYQIDAEIRICYALAQMYENGEGTEQDYNQAMSFYKKSADYGMAEAQIAAALLARKMYSGDEGGLKAEELFAALDDTEKFSSRASRLSANEIWGMRYENGYGVEPSLEKAVEYYEKALETGDRSIALRHLGDIYKTKYDDIKKAFEYYLRGADIGDSEMQSIVAGMYFNGTAGIKDESLAMKYALKAIRRGSVSAMKTMGDIAANNSDEKSAKLWYKVNV